MSHLYHNKSKLHEDLFSNKFQHHQRQHPKLDLRINQFQLSAKKMVKYDGVH